MPYSNDEPLYRPAHPEGTATFRFMRTVNSRFGLSLSTYEDLLSWSTTNIASFWSTVWDETKIVGDKGEHVVAHDAMPADNPAWFSDANLNWAENMLQHRSNKTAIIETTEPLPGVEPSLRQLSFSQLYDAVADVVSAFLLHGFRPGDRVGAYTSNCSENIIACLATTALGGIWVSAAADFGPQGVLERFNQVAPKFIVTVDAVVYNGKVHDHLQKVATLVDGLSTSPKVIVIKSRLVKDARAFVKEHTTWEDLVATGRAAKLGRTPEGEIIWHRGGFNDPLWILFSSGTTGLPKPIVHRAGGMLLQSNKEFMICADLKPDDVFFYFTTTGWMMWNFLVSSLSVGCTLVLYDGSPLRNPSYLWELVDKLGITVFGTSAKYLDALSKVYKPREHSLLKTLRHVYSTGSPLSPALFDFVYEHIHPEILLGSITGGTDICSLFCGMCSALPVYRGEIQCRMLGMAVESFTSEGKPSGPTESGELVCTKPFPCMPAGFWPLPGYGSDEAVKAAAQRYQDAYFSVYEGIWYHGDHILIAESKLNNGGGVVMLGRSDGVLNPSGVRFGSAELYEVIEACFSPTSDFPIVDCVAIGQSTENGMDERVVLFVKLPEGTSLTPEFEKKVRAEIRQRRSPRHVPERILQTPDVPYTLNGKRVEVTVKKIINGAPVTVVNPSTLLNPGCLGFYVDAGYALRKEVEPQSKSAGN